MASANYLMVGLVLLFLGWATIDPMAGSGFTMLVDARGVPILDGEGSRQLVYWSSTMTAVVHNLIPGLTMVGGVVCLICSVLRAASAITIWSPGERKSRQKPISAGELSTLPQPR